MSSTIESKLKQQKVMANRKDCQQISPIFNNPYQLNLPLILVSALKNIAFYVNEEKLLQVAPGFGCIRNADELAMKTKIPTPSPFHTATNPALKHIYQCRNEQLLTLYHSLHPRVCMERVLKSYRRKIIPQLGNFRLNLYEDTSHVPDLRWFVFFNSIATYVTRVWVNGLGQILLGTHTGFQQLPQAKSYQSSHSPSATLFRTVGHQKLRWCFGEGALFRKAVCMLNT